MTRIARAEVFAADEVAIIHVMNRVVRRCFLLGTDPQTGKNYDHRKLWIEELLKTMAGLFGIDLLSFSVLSNHFHLILRSRPDVVKQWSDRDVARRWLLLCPLRKSPDGAPMEPTEPEIGMIVNDPNKLAERRKRLSDISWWMRLLCQRIALRANREEEQEGKFWQNRFRAVRLEDEAAVLACSAYVDLNPIRAGIAETVGGSQHTSARLRFQEEFRAALRGESELAPTHYADNVGDNLRPQKALDGFLAPVWSDERGDAIGPQLCQAGLGCEPERCSDKGFLPITRAAYLELLKWTVSQSKSSDSHAPCQAAPVLTKLNLETSQWLELVQNFGKLFSLVAGQPENVDNLRGKLRGGRFYLRRAARELLAA